MKAIAVYTGGIHGLVEAAVAPDGRVFKRYQGRSRWGLKWTPWRYVERWDPTKLPTSINSGFSTLSRKEGLSRRLPG